MKFGPATNLDKTKTSTSKKTNDDTVLTNYDFTVIFPIYG